MKYRILEKQEQYFSYIQFRLRTVFLGMYSYVNYDTQIDMTEKDELRILHDFVGISEINVWSNLK